MSKKKKQKTTSAGYQVFTNKHSGGLVKAWVDGVPVEEQAKQQLLNAASMPFIHKWVAAMPDMHLGKGACVGSILATKKAIIPAAAGVDLGCGMMAVKTSLTANDLPDNLKGVRSAIERAVPHGRTDNGGRNDRGAWGDVPKDIASRWNNLEDAYKLIADKHPKIKRGKTAQHLGTMGGGNHHLEVCIDETDCVWITLHSGSRGVGNRIGQYFINLAKEDMKKWFIHLPDGDLAYFPEGTEHFNDYSFAVHWAQSFARVNREAMMDNAIAALLACKEIPTFALLENVINCHHNYIEQENHYGENVWVTRKGAIRARTGDLGLIPGSMGTANFIVRGKGNPESFHSCSHGAGRKMSRSAARSKFSLKDHERATAGIECRKDAGVLDETPGAYKDVFSVMEAQKDLVEIVHTLRQVVCIKG